MTLKVCWDLYSRWCRRKQLPRGVIPYFVASVLISTSYDILT